MADTTTRPPCPAPLTLVAEGPLGGTLAVPGDKSISHRALMLGALAVGTTRIEGLLEGEDVAATAGALRAMGATISRRAPGAWTVDGVGVGGLMQPEGALDMGNSGTSARLLMGLVASHPLTVMMTGDASLARRPMGRVIAPLRQCGADIMAAPGERLPLVVRGMAPALPFAWRLPLPSAQVKSAILLAALNIGGETVVEEPEPSRDHSERMLAAFGAAPLIEPMADGGRRIAIRGWAELKPQAIRVPGDISSAAFPLVAALIVPGSAIRIAGVGVNPTRTGLLDVLDAMGAGVRCVDERMQGGEPVADLLVEARALEGIEVPPEIAPRMIDEYPALCVAAAFAAGRTVMRGIGELRVKESDRIALMARALRAAGATVEEGEDWLAVEGRGGEPLPGGARVSADLDHRIAMSCAILSLGCRAPLTVEDRAPIATSFPGFVALMTAAGAAERP